MARIRTIKPEFFKNEELSALSALTRLLFIGLWTMSDREGRLLDRPKRIKADLFPYENYNVDKGLKDLENKGFITRYEYEPDKIIQINNFLKHQLPHYKELPSVLPAQEGHVGSLVIAKPLTRKERDFILERDNKTCKQCGSTQKPTIDHIIPVSKGGDNSPENLQVLCIRCNTSKGNRVNVGSTSGHLSTQEGKGMDNGEWIMDNGDGERQQQPKIDIVQKEENFIVPPPILNIGNYNINDCIKNYFENPSLSRTRELVAMNNHMDLSMLRDWGDAFNRHLITEGKTIKTYDDYNRHFKNWLTLQNKNLNPNKLFTDEQPNPKDKSGDNNISAGERAYNFFNGGN